MRVRARPAIPLAALLPAATLSAVVASCGDDDNEANEQLLGAECASTATCDNPELTCLTEFKGGYCGKKDCASDEECPSGSICVTEEGTTYCFLTCLEKPDCNDHRSLENEANCSSSIEPLNPDNQSKACVPPSSEM